MTNDDKDLKPKMFKLIQHNTNEQQRWGGNDDTFRHLTRGNIYAGFEEVHSFHTQILIGDYKFNSVCFEEIKATPQQPSEPLKELESDWEIQFDEKF